MTLQLLRRFKYLITNASTGNSSPRKQTSDISQHRNQTCYWKIQKLIETYSDVVLPLPTAGPVRQWYDLQRDVIVYFCQTAISTKFPPASCHPSNLWFSGKICLLHILHECYECLFWSYNIWRKFSYLLIICSNANSLTLITYFSQVIKHTMSFKNWLRVVLNSYRRIDFMIYS